MGWTCYRPGSAEEANKEIERLCTYSMVTESGDKVDSKVIQSVHLRGVSYLAVKLERLLSGGGAELTVYGMVVLKEWAAGELCYKEITDDMGPNSYEGCPGSLVEKLSPSLYPYANNWRMKVLRSEHHLSEKGKILLSELEAIVAKEDAKP